MALADGKLPIEVLEPLSTDFFQSHGEFMAEWAGIERGLFAWFAGISGMTDQMSRSVFYSARSFNGRGDMLEDAIEHDKKHTPEEIAFIKAGLKKAWNYSGFRNSAVHGEVILNVGNEEVFYSIIQGYDFQQVPARPILIDELTAATENFAALKQCLLFARPEYRATPGTKAKSIEEYLALVQSLPNQANARSGPAPPKPALQTEEDHRQWRRARAAAILNRGATVRIQAGRIQFRK
jgi:hypothetical protein